MLEIERKFLIKDSPNLKGIPEIKYERYFLEITNNSEIRIQKKGYIYEKETKTRINSLKFEKLKQGISQAEFLELQKQSIWELYRSSYTLNKSPKISLKVYTWRFQWFSRLEIEFNAEEQAKNFKTENWYWKEITWSTLANDSKLVNLSDSQFQTLMRSI